MYTGGGDIEGGLEKILHIVIGTFKFMHSNWLKSVQSTRSHYYIIQFSI